ncbi:c-type cytochrome [Rhodocyclaceae bacterium SMB388]
MREELARWVALLTVVVTVSLSALFAWVHNSGDEPERAAAGRLPAVASKLVDHPGHAVFVAQRCTSCHSVGGEGSPRYPLDGVGARLDREAIRKWIVGAPELQDQLPASAFRRKQQYQALPDAELEVLVDWLQMPAD